MMRYFTDATRLVWSAPTGADAAFYLSPPFTEVQVVPLDAIVIRREDLPEVKTETRPDGRVMLHAVTEPDLTYGPTEKQADRARKYAYAELAVAEAIEAHLREHPPVDEERVKAVKDAMLAEGYGISNPTARRLVQRGVRVVDEP